MSQFEEIIERRNTRSLKWDRMEFVYKLEDASDILPMWVADMDFPAPQPVLDAMQERLNHKVFGYSFPSDDLKDAVRTWFSTKHSWDIERDWILFHQGVVPAIATIVETFTKKQDGILITPPIYPPFFNVPKFQDRTIVECNLVEDNGHYSIDFEAFEQALQQNVKLFILCSPHNPGGIVWTVDVLREIIRLCTKYDVLILSDEIHADLVFEGSKHIPLATLAGDEAKRVITCVAPTKTFNLAGVQAAVIVASDSNTRNALQRNALANGRMELNAFGGAALKAAYLEGGPWLEALTQVISSNMDYVIEELTTKVPGINITKPNGTYLLWIDYRDLHITEEEIMHKLLTIGKLALEPGTKYGEAGRGFLRMNVATPRKIVEDGVQRFIKALQA